MDRRFRCATDAMRRDEKSRQLVVVRWGGGGSNERERETGEFARADIGERGERTHGGTT